jgi:hypothetical protein
MSDIDKSFKFLHENIPQWLHDVASMEATLVSMQDEIARIPMTMVPFTTPEAESVTSPPARKPELDGTPGEALPSNRKRKPLSVLSGRASGPTRYRPRTMVVLTYDGELQKSFELLVRAIGSGRNLLRKAKMEAKMHELAALAGSSEDEGEADEEEEEAILAKISYRPRISSMRTRAAARRSGGANAPVELLDATDKTLEQAQASVETSAHLTLRDGDCRQELQAVRQQFEQVLETAKTEVSKGNARMSLEPPPPPLQPHDVPPTPVSSSGPSYKRHFPHVTTPQQAEPGPPLQFILAAAPALSTPKIMDIEVDDDDDDDDDSDEENFVMPPVRLTSRLGVRA